MKPCVFHKKVGEIVPHTFVPPPFWGGARIVKEKRGYNFPYGGKIRTEIRRFSGFFSDFRIVPLKFLWGYNVCHVGGTTFPTWGTIRHLGVQCVIDPTNCEKCGCAIHEFKELHLKIEPCGELDLC